MNNMIPKVTSYEILYMTTNTCELSLFIMLTIMHFPQRHAYISIKKTKNIHTFSLVHEAISQVSIC